MKKEMLEQAEADMWREPRTAPSLAQACLPTTRRERGRVYGPLGLVPETPAILRTDVDIECYACAHRSAPEGGRGVLGTNQYVTCLRFCSARSAAESRDSPRTPPSQKREFIRD